MSSPTKGLVSVPLRVLSAGLLLIYIVYNFIAKFLYRNSVSEKLPYVNNEILRKSATELARDIRRKKITSSAVVAAFIERQKQVNPIINAIVEQRYDDALRDAGRVDDFLAVTDQTEVVLARDKPLLGVPVTIKESIPMKGMSHVAGTLDRQGMKAEQDGTGVRRLLEAGAIPLCMTTVPECCISFETKSFITGRTNNPYNVHFTPGGSSGGEAAMIASAGSVIGIGSDLAGSVRLPAAFCGIFGHKPSAGLIDVVGHAPWISHPMFNKFLLIGPMCRYAEDLMLMLKVLTVENPILRLEEPVNLGSLRIYFMLDVGSCFGFMGVHHKVKQRLREAVAHFRTTWNCEISDCKFDEVQYTIEATTTLIFSFDDSQYNQHINIKDQLFKTIFGSPDVTIDRLLFLVMKRDKLLIPNNVGKAHKFMEFLSNKISDELGDNGVFFYPVFPSSAFRHGMHTFSLPSIFSYCPLANLTGLPATAIPVGFIENGLPIGIQVIAGRNQDRLCLSVAKELETVFGGWTPP